MAEKKPAAYSTAEGRCQGRTSAHSGVVDILMGISSKSEPPSPELVAGRVQYGRATAATVKPFEDQKDDGDSLEEEEDNFSDFGRNRGGQRQSKRVAAAAATKRKAASQEEPAAAAARKPISPARQRLLAKRRQLYLFRMQEKRRVQNFREKAALALARNMLPPEKVQEMEEMAAANAQKQQQRRHQRTKTLETLVGLADAILEDKKKPASSSSGEQPHYS